MTGRRGKKGENCGWIEGRGRKEKIFLLRSGCVSQNSESELLRCGAQTLASAVGGSCERNSVQGHGADVSGTRESGSVLG